MRFSLLARLILFAALLMGGSGIASAQQIPLPLASSGKAQVRMAQAAMAQRDTSVSELCKELGVKPVTLYRYVDPNGKLRANGQRVLEE